ncbi:MAG: TIGR03032 family protein [Rubripirellula sp.]
MTSVDPVASGNEERDADSTSAMRSVHTSNLPEILSQLGISLLVTTYQAGKLVMLRPENGVLNTHFRLFDKPMGMAVQPNRIAIGSAMQLWEFHNIPAVCERLDTARDATDELPAREASRFPHDACFLPRVAHFTGDIDIHEMSWIDDDVVFINTRFSCLARRSGTYNFEPVWRPSFITQYIPGDCCHLNGMAIRDGNIDCVTALGMTNEPGSWRANKKDGGVLIDVASSEIIAHGLSMPHSPRWYDGKLYLLHSGTGGFGVVDPATGKYESIVELPGFTRGLSFCGPLAFIGLSQVRETAVFGGVPIAERELDERTCGVWVVNIQSGEIVAFVKFEDAVQEIFAVEVLHGSTYPELVNDDRELLASSYELPDAALADVPTELRC